MATSIKHAAAQRRTKRFQLGPTKRDLDEISRALADERVQDLENAYDPSVEDALADRLDSAGEEDRWLLTRSGCNDEERYS